MSKNATTARRLPRHIEDFEVNRYRFSTEVMVTLAWGWSYLPNEHSGVRGFDTVTEAQRESARKRLYPCRCELCLANMEGAR